MTESVTDSGLSAAQHRAIAALLSARTMRDAATAVHVSERTLYRWLADPRFAAALAAAEGQAIDHATRRLVGLQDAAIGALETVLGDEAAPASTKLRAAVAVLEQLLKLRELRNVEARLAALEAGQLAGERR